jgi:hypothetical protein
VDSPKLRRTEAKISGQRNRVQPELRRLIVAIHMHMGRLLWLKAVKIDAVRPTISMVGTPFSISLSCGGFRTRCCGVNSLPGAAAGADTRQCTTFLYTVRPGGVVSSNVALTRRLHGQVPLTGDVQFPEMPFLVDYRKSAIGFLLLARGRPAAPLVVFLIETVSCGILAHLRLGPA